jgi:hypothetical protein
MHHLTLELRGSANHVCRLIMRIQTCSWAMVHKLSNSTTEKKKSSFILEGPFLYICQLVLGIRITHQMGIAFAIILTPSADHDDSSGVASITISDSVSAVRQNCSQLNRLALPMLLEFPALSCTSTATTLATSCAPIWSACGNDAARETSCPSNPTGSCEALTSLHS